MCCTAPFRLVTEAVLQVRPYLLNATEVLLERIVRRGYDVILFIQRHQHVLDFAGGMSKELPARYIAWIECGSVHGSIVGRSDGRIGIRDDARSTVMSAQGSGRRCRYIIG